MVAARVEAIVASITNHGELIAKALTERIELALL